LIQAQALRRSSVLQVFVLLLPRFSLVEALEFVEALGTLEPLEPAEPPATFAPVEPVEPPVEPVEPEPDDPAEPPEALEPAALPEPVWPLNPAAAGAAGALGTDSPPEGFEAGAAFAAACGFAALSEPEWALGAALVEEPAVPAFAATGGADPSAAFVFLSSPPLLGPLWLLAEDAACAPVPASGIDALPAACLPPPSAGGTPTVSSANIVSSFGSRATSGSIAPLASLGSGAAAGSAAGAALPLYAFTPVFTTFAPSSMLFLSLKKLATAPLDGELLGDGALFAADDAAADTAEGALEALALPLAFGAADAEGLLAGLLAGLEACADAFGAELAALGAAGAAFPLSFAFAGFGVLLYTVARVVGTSCTEAGSEFDSSS
jgi:hypothetical protein